MYQSSAVQTAALAQWGLDAHQLYHLGSVQRAALGASMSGAIRNQGVMPSGVVLGTGSGGGAGGAPVTVSEGPVDRRVGLLTLV